MDRVVKEVLNQPLNILISYYYFEKAELKALIDSQMKYWNGIKVFADCGAFSAEKQGKHISLEQYMAWLQKWKDCLVVYSNLDVIYNPRQTMENQLIMEREGLKPLPVFHIQEDWKYLHKYFDNYTYIALGGTANHPKKKKMAAWIRECFKRKPEHVRYHGFGVSSPIIIKEFPWYSLDTTTWLNPIKFPDLALYNPLTNKVVKISKGNLEGIMKAGEIFRAFGVSPYAFIKGRRIPRPALVMLCYLSYQTMVRCNSIHNGNIHNYLGCSVDYHYKELGQAIESYCCVWESDIIRLGAGREAYDNARSQ